MINSLKRILETVLISSVVFIALDNSKRHAAADLRDAVRDTTPTVLASGNSLKDLNPSVRDSAVPESKPASDWTAYIQDAEGEKDVFISKIYPQKKLARKEMAAAARDLETEGKKILFSSLLRETAGGFFYVIRLDNSPSAVRQVAAASSNRDEALINTVRKYENNIEHTCREIWTRDAE